MIGACLMYCKDIFSIALWEDQATRCFRAVPCHILQCYFRERRLPAL